MRKTLFIIFFFIIGTFSQSRGQSPWRIIATPTTKDLHRMSFLDSTRGWVCGKQGTILKTTNSGKNWVQQEPGVTDDIFDIFMLNERLGWAIGWVDFTDTLTFFGSRILRTTDGGTTWTGDIFPIVDRYFHSISFFDSLNGWMVGVRGDIEKSTDGGLTWVRAEIDSSAGSSLDVLNVEFFSRNYGFALGGWMDVTGMVWRTTNGGERWFAQSVAPEPVYEIHFSDSLHAVALTGDLEYGASIIRTKDGGDRWVYTYLGFYGMPRAMSFRTSYEGWVALGNMLMVTKDTAETWNVVDTLGWRQMFDLVFTDSLTGYACADSGAIYKYDPHTTDVREHPSVIPTSHRLDQNYPNPFNPLTTIRFAVGNTSREERISLRVFDMLGREVATLVDGAKQPGEYSVVWDARDAASGLYFYRLEAGSFVDVKKTLLIR